MNSEKVYLLAKGVQVRKEIFGLLFYDYRGPRLYFVPSKDLFTDTFFNGSQSVKKLAEALCSSTALPCKQIQDQINKVLEMLEGKGLIYGQSIC
ncbi:Putative electron carrier mycofactocin, MtfB-like [Desulfonema limicola]|uniref:Electron carrier mycofactocin, MtfB-like n=1 Tax=Desulfonema limicola TaxID=45656 RepID=A0A975B9P5_9BACT|nr:mycofactocin biosynthesis chaperone MftB [Desulfonema limicola]QTA81412.1 Putative electron carrier mycofactocin, MtfB-like [Desulfonema limicola]